MYIDWYQTVKKLVGKNYLIIFIATEKDYLFFGNFWIGNVGLYDNIKCQSVHHKEIR
jgi:hypothetical protein